MVASADDMEQEEGSGNVSKGKRVGGCHHPALLQSGKEGLNVRMTPVEVSSFSTVCVHVCVHACAEGCAGICCGISQSTYLNTSVSPFTDTT